MSELTEMVAMSLTFFAGMATGILYGWMNKDRYPGNEDVKQWSKGHRIGYKAGKKDGKKELMEQIEKVKVETDERKEADVKTNIGKIGKDS